MAATSMKSEIANENGVAGYRNNHRRNEEKYQNQPKIINESAEISKIMA